MILILHVNIKKIQLHLTFENKQILFVIYELKRDCIKYEYILGLLLNITHKINIHFLFAILTLKVQIIYENVIIYFLKYVVFTQTSLNSSIIYEISL